MKNLTRRQAIALTSLAGCIAGCDNSLHLDSARDAAQAANQKAEELVDATETEDLKSYKLALRGYEIVSMVVAGRLILLPYPGMRILSVVIMASSATAKLAVQYIDDELIQRAVEEAISDQERTQLESDNFVAFKTESGLTETMYLSPTVYS